MSLSITSFNLLKETHPHNPYNEISTIANSARLGRQEEDLFRKHAEEDFKLLLKQFSMSEHMSICLTPLVIAQCAIIYAQNAMSMARELRLSELKPLSRKIKKLLDEYHSVLRIDLDEEHIENIERKTKEFLECSGSDFFKFWIQINSELKKVYPDCAHMELRTHGLMSASLVGIYHEYNRMINLMIEQRLGEKHNSVDNRLILLLGKLVKEYAGECEIEDTDILRNCRKIVLKCFKNMKYETV